MLLPVPVSEPLLDVEPVVEVVSVAPVDPVVDVCVDVVPTVLVGDVSVQLSDTDDPPYAVATSPHASELPASLPSSFCRCHVTSLGNCVGYASAICRPPTGQLAALAWPGGYGCQLGERSASEVG